MDLIIFLSLLVLATANAAHKNSLRTPSRHALPDIGRLLSRDPVRKCFQNGEGPSCGAGYQCCVDEKCCGLACMPNDWQCCSSLYESVAPPDAECCGVGGYYCPSGHRCIDNQSFQGECDPPVPASYVPSTSISVSYISSSSYAAPSGSPSSYAASASSSSHYAASSFITSSSTYISGNPHPTAPERPTTSGAAGPTFSSANPPASSLLSSTGPRPGTTNQQPGPSSSGVAAATNAAARYTLNQVGTFFVGVLAWLPMV